MFVLLFCAVLSQGQPANDSSTMENNANESALLNETAANATPASMQPNLNYIWSLTGIEAGPITMALNQEGNELYGQAAYEPEGGKAWNADVIGSVAGEKVDLTMSALKDNVLIITRFSGILANEDINGNFTQASEGKVINNGTFNAMWINPDTSSYTPATVEVPAAVVAPAAIVANATTTNETDEEEEKSRFVDVREYKDKIGPGGDLSGIPPGMG